MPTPRDLFDEAIRNDRPVLTETDEDGKIKVALCPICRKPETDVPSPNTFLQRVRENGFEVTRCSQGHVAYVQDGHPTYGQDARFPDEIVWERLEDLSDANWVH